MVLNEDNDFGFSLVDEAELKKQEELLKKQLEQQTKVVAKTEADYSNKLEGLRAMVMPLLNNLAKDPEKTYVFWPDRAAKVKAFIDKVNKYVDG